MDGSEVGGEGGGEGAVGAKCMFARATVNACANGCVDSASARARRASAAVACLKAGSDAVLKKRARTQVKDRHTRK